MNFKAKLDLRVWEAIQHSYQSSNFTGAIMDAIYFLGDLIREKTGLQSDGVTLVGQAFGGKSPLLKINKLQTESEKNMQKGLEQILRGIYQAVRNPRSHEKFEDKEEDADSIILFLNYVIGLIEESKPPFTKTEFLNTVFDPNFVENNRYANLVVDQIPVKQIFDIFVEVIRKIKSGNGKKLYYFFEALTERLKEEEKTEAYRLVSEIHKTTNDIEIIGLIIQAWPYWWEKFEEVARLRIENRLINSIKESELLSTRHVMGESLGIWAAAIVDKFTLKSELLDVLFSKLESNENTQRNYVLTFFPATLVELMEKPMDGFKNIMIEGLERGDKYFYNALCEALDYSESNEWKKAFAKEMSNFKENYNLYGVDDLPF